MPGDQVDYVIMGQVLQAGAGQITARQAAVDGGIPMTVPSLTINKVCLSGLDAIALADQLIRAGEFDVVVAGGMESMTQRAAPAAGRAARLQVRQRRSWSTRWPTTACPTPSTSCAMGESTERHNGQLGISRAEQDEFAARSHQLAAAGRQGRAVRRGDRARADAAAPRRPADGRHRRGRPARTRPPSRWPGCARPSPPTARSRPGRRRRSPTGRARSWSCPRPRRSAAARPCWPRSARTASSPGPTTRCTPSRPTPSRRPWAGPARPSADLDLIEINEAFAAVAIQSMRDLGVDPGRGQRQRRGHRPRPPDRRVRRPHRAAPDHRAAPPRRRPRRRGAVRRRRPGRRAALPGARTRR